MKKLLIILLAMLLLAGCASQAPAETTAGTTAAATEETTQPKPVVGIYDASDPVEQQTGGAVRAYPLGDGAYTGLLTMGQRLMVVSADGDITVLQGEIGEIVATVATDLGQNWGSMDLRAWEQGVAYYVEQTREVVILNEQFQEVSRMQLPEAILGKPAIHLNQGEVFYCVGTEIRAMNIQTGISRLVRSHNCMSQELVGSFFEDTILGCQIVDSQGAQSIVYLSAETGAVVNSDLTLGSLQTYGQDYFAIRTEGQQKQILFGSGEGETMCLNTDAQNLTGALALGGAVDCTADETGVHLAFYDFATGKRSAEISIDGLTAPRAILADEKYLWLLCDQVLYRWDVSASQIADEAVYTGPLYTAETPDTEGLAACQTRVDALNARYGITLQIWQDAAQEAGGYAYTAEYQVSQINKALDTIEATLAKFPEGFLTTTGNIRIALVRSIEGGSGAVQYWNGSQCNVVLTCGEVEKNLLWGLGWGVDTRVLGNSRDFDEWDDLNPGGFEYTYDYAENAAREDADEYLDGDSRAFVDVTSMSFPTEDRARLFAAAVMEGNEEMFASSRMQKKLLRLCEGIREAYGLVKSTTVFPWEQYLEEPIAKDA